MIRVEEDLGVGELADDREELPLLAARHADHVATDRGSTFAGPRSGSA
jgi:hypothetical protein